MNPLLTLWLMVLASTIALSGFFYLAENYAHIIGNFYFIAGVSFGSYFLYILISYLMNRNKKKNALTK